MNFTDSPFEQMMKEAPRPGRGSSGPCAGCRYAKECKNPERTLPEKVPCPACGAAGFRANMARSPDGPGADP